jgi:hypothetical protein
MVKLALPSKWPACLSLASKEDAQIATHIMKKRYTLWALLANALPESFSLDCHSKLKMDQLTKALSWYIVASSLYYYSEIVNFCVTGCHQISDSSFNRNLKVAV